MVLAMLRFLVLTAAALLVPALPASAQAVLPTIGIDGSGACRALTVRDATNGAMVPLGCVDTTVHGFVSRPNKITIMGPGSTGDVSGMSVIPQSGSPIVATPLVDALRCIYPQPWGFATVATPAQNAAAIQAAAGVAAAAGRPVCLMSGAYTTAAIALPAPLAGLQVRAEPGSKLTLASGANAPLVVVSAPNVHWSGGQFDGNAAGNPSFTGGGLIDVFADGFTMDAKASITNTNGFGIRSIASRTTLDDIDVSATKQTGIWAEALSFTGAAPLTDFSVSNSRIVHTTQNLGDPTDMCVQVHATSKPFIRVRAANNTCTLPDVSTFAGQTEGQAFTVMGFEFLGMDPSTARLIDWKLLNNTVTGGGQSYSVGNTTTGTAIGNTARNFAWHGFEAAQNNRDVTVTGGSLDGTGAKGYAAWASANNWGVNFVGVAMTAGLQGGFYGYNTQVTLQGGSIYQPNAAPAVICTICTTSQVLGVAISGVPTEGVLMVLGTNNSIGLNNISGTTIHGIRVTDVQVSGSYRFNVFGNTINKTSGDDISHAEFNSASTCTGSRLNGNVTTAPAADWAASGTAAGNCF